MIASSSDLFTLIFLLVNILRSYSVFCVFGKNYTLSKFQLCNTVLSTITTMFSHYILRLNHFIAESSYCFINFSLFTSQPLATTFSFSVSMCLLFLF